MRIKREFKSSKYWNERYKHGGNSGDGSYGHLAEYKAEIINDFIEENQIHNIIEFGSGDGNQLKYMNYENYIGFDISEYIVEKCNKTYINDNTKTFKLYTDYNDEQAELTLSLDVIFHLIEDDVFNDYMNKLFNASSKYVIIYSSNTKTQISFEVKHFKNRKFTDWIELNEPEFELVNIIKNKYPYEKFKNKGSVSDFFIYKK